MQGGRFREDEADGDRIQRLIQLALQGGWKNPMSK